MQSTKELADVLRMRPKSIIHRLGKTGSFHGVVPFKLPNRRLLWPDDAVEHLLGKFNRGKAS